MTATLTSHHGTGRVMGTRPCEQLRAGIVAAMNSLEVVDLEGLAGDYRYGSPEARDPARLATYNFNSAAATPSSSRAQRTEEAS